MKEFRAADAGERQEKMGMEKICVYADFDFLKEKEQIGTLFGEQVRGSRHFSFEFATGWLEDHGSVILGGDMQNEAGRQYPPEGEQLFSFIRQRFRIAGAVCCSASVCGSLILPLRTARAAWMETFFSLMSSAAWAEFCGETALTEIS